MHFMHALKKLTRKKPKSFLWDTKMNLVMSCHTPPQRSKGNASSCSPTSFLNYKWDFPLFHCFLRGAVLRAITKSLFGISEKTFTLLLLLWSIYYSMVILRGGKSHAGAPPPPLHDIVLHYLPYSREIFKAENFHKFPGFGSVREIDSHTHT